MLEGQPTVDRAGATASMSSSRRLPGSHQRTPAGNRTTVRGRYPGFRVIACVILPKGYSRGARLSGVVDVRWPVTVAGAAAASHRVPVQSLSGTLYEAGMILNIGAGSIDQQETQ